MRVLPARPCLWLNHCILLCLAQLLAACATPTTQAVDIDKAASEVEAQLQRELAFEGFLEDELRVKRVAHPILVAAAPLCKDKTHYESGAVFTTADGFGKDYTTTVSRFIGGIAGNQLGLLHVVPGSPADQAGLRRGDRLLEINGYVVPDAKDASEQLAKQAKEWLKNPTPLKTSYLRTTADGGTQTLHTSISPVLACDYEAVLIMEESLNAFADGQRIAIFRGMLRFANDQELAIMIGHELAHNFMGHIEAQQRNGLLGTIAEIIATAKGIPTQGALGAAISLKFSPAFEAEADYVGLYVLARSGIEIKDAAKFWRRMAAANPNGISQRGMIASHPATSDRFIALQKAVQEIEAKRAAGKVLDPELKK
jgi:membrane-associated protease RseP (regulator of RpoE activity)